MCRGENVQCKECCRLSSRIVELCIRGELMATCPETIIEGVSLEKEEHLEGLQGATHTAASLSASALEVSK
ncbi:hypothetical protein FOPG_04929 [Fusarium oxysporum f. sp. conglutinans race 2 54008]|uniref:Uncharacterized protein n=1 Tax=Fusarium oxysporum f. sp. conglutinans race 2 54008 TaxID=1089457 RepID=X0JA16_FUSOX|nr:hypothetical protein FOWG_07758 [Fusarium oxysporum f. sp. lycopersici MN25]EXL81939.1 hypothetical protein FOPG_04929 [Fusarium oxysporum f. sp. conglutinans race 2 54008]